MAKKDGSCLIRYKYDELDGTMMSDRYIVNTAKYKIFIR